MSKVLKKNAFTFEDYMNAVWLRTQDFIYNNVEKAFAVRMYNPERVDGDCIQFTIGLPDGQKCKTPPFTFEEISTFFFPIFSDKSYYILHQKDGFKVCWRPDEEPWIIFSEGELSTANFKNLNDELLNKVDEFNKILNRDPLRFKATLETLVDLGWDIQEVP